LRFRDVAQFLATSLYETLCPLALGLSMNIGFSPVWAVAGMKGVASGFLKDLDSADLEPKLRDLAGSESSRIDRADVKFGLTTIGVLTILWPEIDPLNPLSSTLVRSDPLHLESLLPSIANAVMRSAEVAFFHHLNDLQSVLIQIKTPEEWISAIESTIRGAMLEWVLAELPAGVYLGHGPNDVVEKWRADAPEDQPLWHRPIAISSSDARHLVRLILPGCEVKLWIGVKNPGLKPELEEAWPWRGFLERLAGAAGAAWVGMSKSEELVKVRHEAGQIQGLLQSTVDTGTFIHEMRNIARNFKLAAQSLGEAKRLGKLQASIDIEKDIEDMQRSAERLHGLADNVLKPSALVGRLIYPLADVVQEVADLYEPILHQNDIVLLNEVPADLEVATPSHAVHVAFVSLISNSIDAIVSGGTIRIVGVPSSPNGQVLCHVIDDGPGIRLADPETVFEFGTSTKRDTGGVGLFMIKKLIESVDAEIVLTDARMGQTTFTLQLRSTPRKD